MEKLSSKKPTAVKNYMNAIIVTEKRKVDREKKEASMRSVFRSASSPPHFSLSPSPRIHFDRSSVFLTHRRTGVSLPDVCLYNLQLITHVHLTIILNCYLRIVFPYKSICFLCPSFSSTTIAKSYCGYVARFLKLALQDGL